MADHNNHKSCCMHFCRAAEASLSLPPELLLDIFAHLPRESVRSLLLVCRDWNALVSCPGSWTVWREWTRQAAPEVYEAGLAREQSARKANPCWRALYIARESSRFLRRQRQQRQKQEAELVDKEKQLREQEQLVMAQLAYTSMALSSEKRAWKQMFTAVVSISSLTTFAFLASMSLAY